MTGGGSGIGKAMVKAFTESGAKVVILDLDESKAAEVGREISPDIRAFGCDVSHAESVTKAFERVLAEGEVDVLVNSAGVSHVGNIFNTTEADFDRLFRVNVKGTYLCMQAAVQAMKTAGGGVILNLASIAATSGLSDRFAYSMTKGAVLSMTLSVARDSLAHKIRCNCVSPARVHTPFVDDFVSKNYPGREAEMMAALSKSQPIGRMGTPEEIALLALYLCSDAASFVTGADYPIDGGYFNLRQAGG